MQLMASVADYMCVMLRILTRTTTSSTFILLFLFVCVFLMISVMDSDIPFTGINSVVDTSSMVLPDYQNVKAYVDTTWNVQKFSDIFSQATSCKRNILLLVLVTSAPENFEIRASIRKTWASVSDKGSTSSQVVFLLGKTYHPATQVLLEDEVQRHDDILQGNFIDSYRNLTLKVQNGFLWAAKVCQPRFILKTDDDCFVNIKLMTHYLLNHNTIKSKLYAGNRMKTLDVIRRNDSKWRVSNNLYPRHEYPPYASGTGYLLSGDVLQRMVKAAKHIKPFPVEDAYTGVIAEYLGIPLIDSGRFTLFNANWNTCNYRYLFVIHRVSPEQQFVCQNHSIESEVKCADQKEITRWD
ncbi:beta-1,3-galactosyltransferase 1-like [Anneissia japonica]|uniref:beta-1,3-galactosyltransferase 1-like n=1 Tax=Anneissia japonica TaxID=1529436 RepID=UPI0014255ADB|nr:beta-1,3-galactosyltransferase 1-like [Anneissia japonica]XP_033117102.1 beta-1,3-galactosyltransferase 1-like [Anneissia japonica]